MLARRKLRLPLFDGLGFSLARPSLEGILLSFGAIAMFLTRPTAFGERFTAIGIAIIAVITVMLILLRASKRRGLIEANSLQVWIYAAYSIYSAADMAVRPSFFSPDSVKGLIIDLIGAVFMLVMLADKGSAISFFDTLARIVIISAYSTVCTFAIVMTTHQLPVITHYLYDYPLPSGTILFPCSMLYNYTQSWFGTAPRLDGFFREVGIYPGFLAWAAGYAYFRRWGAANVAICLVTSLVCLSTLGPIAAIVSAAGILGKRFKAPWWLYFVVAPMTCAIAIGLTYNLPYVGIGYKIRMLHDSYADRAFNTANIFNSDNILFGSSLGSGDRNEGINLVSSISIIGLVGFALLSAVMLLAARRPYYFVAALLPIAIIAFTSEPIAFEPLYIVLFISWRLFSEQSTRTRLPSVVRHIRISRLATDVTTPSSTSGI